jgi:hypothetical protein
VFLGLKNIPDFLDSGCFRASQMVQPNIGILNGSILPHQLEAIYPFFLPNGETLKELILDPQL